MKFLIGYAGIPREAYDAVYRSRRRFLGEDAEFIGETFKENIPKYYSRGHANFFLKSFRRALAEDSQNALRDTGFAIIYVASHADAADFALEFFPSVLTVGVDWTFSGGNRTTSGASVNKLLEALERASNLAKAAIPVIKKEITEQDGTTPLLLPVKNFRSAALAQQLAALQASLLQTSDHRAEIERTRTAFQHQHPPQKPRESSRPCYVDTRGVEFHPPGRARHAFARNVFEGHPPLCLIGGRRRLGAPFDRAFHYDCARGRKPVKGSFDSCHDPQSSMTGQPHLNIAPNDFVRGQK